MEIGISTASLFGRQYNEDALVTLNQLDARVCEVFLETYCEYTMEFAKLLKLRQGNLKVHSIHTLNTHFEPQLFSNCERTRNDSLKIFEDCLKVGNYLGASNYTLHGKAKFKKGMKFENYQEIGGYMNTLIDLGKKYNIDITLENVEWAYYGKPGFFTEVKKYAPDLKCCLDIKQAMISGYDYNQYFNEMGTSLKTVHISDVDDNGKVAMPSEKGHFDFYKLFSQLKDIGFNGNCLIEVYKDNFKEISELKRSLDYLRNIKEKIF